MNLKSISGAVALSICVAGTAFVVGQKTTSHDECNNTKYLLESEVKCLTERLNAQKKRVDELKGIVFDQSLTIDELSSGSVVAPRCKIYASIPLSEELQQYTYEQCVVNNCADYYETVLALMWQESNFNPVAVSSTGDYGIMQINTINHSRLSQALGISNFLDAKQNIAGGIYILSDLIKKYDSENLVLMAYNMGEGGAAAQWEKGIYSSSYSNNIIEKKNKIKTAK
jgi:hypothetical protein